jgi:hypothetical protein
VIYLHRISDVKVGGVSARNFRMFRELCGETTLKNVVIATTRWDKVSCEMGEARENQLRTDPLFFKPTLDKGATLFRHSNDIQSAHKIIRRLLSNQPIVLSIQHELVDLGKNMEQTKAGVEANHILSELQEKHAKYMQEVRLQFERETERREQETRRKAAEEQRRLEEEIEREKARAEEVARENRARLRAIEIEKDEARAGAVGGGLVALALLVLI